MQRGELEKVRYRWVHSHVKYKMYHWIDFDYSVLNNIMYTRRSGRGQNDTWADVIIMADTETSKKYKRKEGPNHVVAWTISVRFFDMNICTLYGHRPDTFCDCLQEIRENIPGDRFILFFHNLPYDWCFLRRFIFQKFGEPKKQLNIKNHYPLFINLENGIQIRDSLMLSQRSLDKWAKDLQVEHQKAKGKWDYDKIRTQHENFTQDELEYIEHDTLAGVECIDKTLKALNKHIYSIPYTATGIPREEVRKRGNAAAAKDFFNMHFLTYEQYKKLELVFHGGYTHANRHLIDEVIDDITSCYDFASSYPFVLLSERYPVEKFTPYADCKLKDIVNSKDNTAFMFKLILYRPKLKNDFIPMPVLQYSKCVQDINVVVDNGRILKADYIEIYLNEIDASIVLDQYDFEGDYCVEVEGAHKDYLPRWFTDYIFELFTDKCRLKKTKKEDPVSYALKKAELNSLYGLTVQKSIKTQIDEVYADYIDEEGKEHKSGDYETNDSINEEAQYKKYLENKGNILLFSWGCWCTSYAMYNLFQLSKCIDDTDTVSHWIYSDTDSIYSDNWNEDKVNEYNEKAKEKLRANNYGPAVVDGKEYWLGIAEHDPDEDEYTEYKVLGAKRYCGRNKTDKELHITVAGVPKKGAICLHDDIRNFTKGFIFSGSVTGKLTHTYYMTDDIYTDNKGNLTGDSINLTPCDYLLDDVKLEDPEWWSLFDEEVEVQVYE